MAKWFRVDEETGHIIARVDDGAPPTPDLPPGTLEGLVLYVADWFARVREKFWQVGDEIDDLWIVGDALAYPFIEIGGVFDGIQRGIRSWSPTARDIDSKLHDLLTIEGITDSFAAIFFEDKAPLAFITDIIVDWYDKYIQPVIDGVNDNVAGFFNYVDNAIDNLEIPDWSSLSDGAGEWLRDQLYKILPWGDLPDVSMLDEARAWVNEELENNSWFQDVKADIESVKGDGNGFFDSPTEWLKDKIEDALIAMLKVAGMPLIRAIGEFINRMLDETEDD